MTLWGIEPIEINDQIVMDLAEMEKIANSVEDSGESLYMRGKKVVEKIYLAASLKTQKHLTIEKLKGQSLFGHITLKHSERSDLAAIAARLL